MARLNIKKMEKYALIGLALVCEITFLKHSFMPFIPYRPCYLWNLVLKSPLKIHNDKLNL